MDGFSDASQTGSQRTSIIDTEKLNRCHLNAFNNDNGNIVSSASMVDACSG